MDIQNISGVDAIPEGFSSNTEISNEITKTEEESKIQETTARYENKGKFIDTTA